MTKIPFERRDMIRPAEGPDYTVPSECSHPYCDEHQIEEHHVVRRSEMAGPYRWVQYGDLLIPNITGLCNAHHREITENKASIRWSSGFVCFLWVDKQQQGWEEPLTPRLKAIQVAPDTVRGETELVWSGAGRTGHNKEICPNCKRPFRKKSPQEKAKVRQTWAVSVPKDEQEDGADVLDTLLEETRKLMAQAGMVAYSDEGKARYYILSAALGLFVQHAQQVLSDG